MIYAILLGFYWAITAFATIVVVSVHKRMTRSDVVVALAFGPFIIPAALLAHKVIK